ncbi:MAG: Rne/Rng family ribonuclease [Proteobacteria bacterium]|nr:Rne/Rng family ribonuclease [Pseudomonadota bacterium]MBU1710988.1 Rne/Rng family ribonuclease [Pseudomonadota bacterium]
MATDLIINATSFEIRIALVEYGNLVEFYLERPTEKGLVGNIYRGRVRRVLPGMQAAFVDIGLDRTGFLYVDDIFVNPEDYEQRISKLEQTEGREPCCVNGLPESLPRAVPGVDIDDLLTEGQDILVQICKEPMGTKGARLTSHITLPSRNLVFMASTDHVGISKKIDQEDVRQRLREDIEVLRPAGTGFIVRTAGEDASREDLEADMEYLLYLWSETQGRASKASVPSLVYEDLDITLRTVRDIFTTNVDRLVVDDRKTYERVLDFVDRFAPHLKEKVHFCEEGDSVFDVYGIEMDASRALEKKIWLRCGGYIVIETTEALTVIDVNTGRYVGKADLEETIFKTNMEAVKEIAYQLRLRNIGGIIIIDFIDMENEAHREEMFKALQESCKKDKSRINILRVSEFGLVQMTRKRNREDLFRSMSESCIYCHGEGVLKSRRSICYEIFRKIVRNAKKMPGTEVTIKVHPHVASLMFKDESGTIDRLEEETGKRIVIVPNKDLHMERYEVVWKAN